MRCPICGHKMDPSDTDDSGHYVCPNCGWYERGVDDRCADCDPVKHLKCSLCIGS